MPVGPFRSTAHPRQQHVGSHLDNRPIAPDVSAVAVMVAGTIVHVNAQAQAEALFGYTRKQLMGSQLEMLLPESMRDVHVAHRARFAEDPYRRAMGLGRDLRGRRCDGSEFPAEISLTPVGIGHLPWKPGIPGSIRRHALAELEADAPRPPAAAGTRPRRPSCI